MEKDQKQPAPITTVLNQFKIQTQENQMTEVSLSSKQGERLSQRKRTSVNPQKKEDKGSNKLLMVLLTSVTVSQLMYLTFPAFAPIYAKVKHSDMNPILFSIIASMYNLSRLLLSTTIGATMNKVGKKRYIQIGFGILILCCLCFATLQFIPDDASDYFFFAGALVINFVQGIGGSILQIAGQAIVLQQFGSRREVGLAYLSAARGLGFLGGPLLGQLFFNVAGFAGAFSIFAGVLLFTVAISSYMLPDSLNANPAAKQAGQQVLSVQQVTYGQILRIPRALFCILCVTFALIFTVFMIGYLSQFLTETPSLKIPKEYIGYIICMWAFFYTLAAFFAGPLSKKFSQRVVSFCSYNLIALACLLFGPSKLLRLTTLYPSNLKECASDYTSCLSDPKRLPQSCLDSLHECEEDARSESVWILLGSLVLLGLGAGTVTVPILLELVQAIKEAMGARPGANERGSALFTMGAALGSIIGNWVGGILYKQFGNPTTCDIMALTSFSMGLLYFLLNIKPGFLLPKTPPQQPQPSPPAQNPYNGVSLVKLLEEESKNPDAPQAVVPVAPVPKRYSINQDSESRQPGTGAVVFVGGDRRVSASGRMIEGQLEGADAYRNKSYKQIHQSTALDMVIPASEEAKEYLQEEDEGVDLEEPSEQIDEE